MEKITGLKSLLMTRLQMLCNAELQLADYLKDIYDNISSPIARRLVAENYERSKIHVESIQIILSEAGVFFHVKENPVIREMILESITIYVKCSDSEVGDAGLISSIQNIKHYLISGYGNASVYAKALSLSEIEDLFRFIEQEEKQHDEKFNSIVKNHVIAKARPMVL